MLLGAGPAGNSRAGVRNSGYDYKRQTNKTETVTTKREEKLKIQHQNKENR